MNKKIIILIVVFLIVAFTLFPKKSSSSLTPLLVGDKKISVEIADSDAERSQGLSGRKKIDDNFGMLFMFPYPAVYPFWMKDMKFPLDFIWIKDNTVVDLSQNIPSPKNPSEQPATIQPSTPINWVLEVNSGLIKKYEIKVGDRVTINNTL